MRGLWLLLAVTLTFACGENTHAEPGKTLSITIDDLPWAGLSPLTSYDEIAPHHDRLIEQLRRIDAPVIGFVNEGKLRVSGQVDPSRAAMLGDWLKAGADLGNHTFGHLDLHAVGMEMYRTDILRGDAFIRALLAEQDRVPRWFRHPYLRAGRDADTRDALHEFLSQHGYRVAPVTIDNSEWVWAKAYRECLNDVACGRSTRERLKSGYVRYMMRKIDYYERQSQEFFGRQIAQILLLHANELNAVSLERLVNAIRAQGYELVSLDTAVADPVHQSPDGYNGAFGPSWIHRWALGLGHKPDSFAGEPEVPEWVLKRAGVDSE